MPESTLWHPGRPSGHPPGDPWPPSGHPSGIHLATLWDPYGHPLGSIWPPLGSIWRTPGSIRSPHWNIRSCPGTSDTRAQIPDHNRSQTPPDPRPHPDHNPPLSPMTVSPTALRLSRCTGGVRRGTDRCGVPGGVRVGTEGVVGTGGVQGRVYRVGTVSSGCTQGHSSGGQGQAFLHYSIKY